MHIFHHIHKIYKNINNYHYASFVVSLTYNVIMLFNYRFIVFIKEIMILCKNNFVLTYF